MMPQTASSGSFFVKGEIIMTAECPECAGDVKFKEAPMLHELVRCGECGAELEVVALDPIKLDLAPTEEEDWGE